MPYEILEHTADTGIRVTAASMEELFQDAAYGMFAVINDAPPDGWDEKYNVTLDAAAPADLLVDWLSELLYLFDVKKLWPVKITNVTLDDDGLNATIEGIKFRGQITGTEVKAITYHMLEVRQSATTGYETDIYFDL